MVVLSQFAGLNYIPKCPCVFFTIFLHECLVCISARAYLEGVSCGTNILTRSNHRSPGMTTLGFTNLRNNRLSCIMHAKYIGIVQGVSNWKFPKGECALKKPYDRNTQIRVVG